MGTSKLKALEKLSGKFCEKSNELYDKSSKEKIRTTQSSDKEFASYRKLKLKKKTVSTACLFNLWSRFSTFKSLESRRVCSMVLLLEEPEDSYLDEFGGSKWRENQK